jgi:primosomal protein N' (replication factor Y)
VGDQLELEAGAVRTVAQVVLLPSPAGLPESLTYLVPDTLRDIAGVGMPVLAPLGGREQLGYILSLGSLADEPETRRLRPIRAIPRPEPAFDAHTAELLRWLSREYRCSLAEALPLAVPERHGAELQSVVSLGTWDGSVPPRIGLLTRQTLEAVYRALTEAGGSLSRDALEAAVRAANLGPALRRARTEGWVRQEQLLLPPRVHARTLKGLRIADCGAGTDLTPQPPSLPGKGEQPFPYPESSHPHAGARLSGEPGSRVRVAGVGSPIPQSAVRTPHSNARLGKSQARVLEYLRERNGDAVAQRDLCAELKVNPSVVNGLVRRGLVEVTDIAVRRAPRGYGSDRDQAPELSPFQATAAGVIGAAMRRAEGETLLLFGVTGSGKTEVYLHAIEQARASGRTAVLLVPEISLTAQVATAVRRRLGERVAILHSALSEGERFDEWERLRRGEADVVVGPRSALFAPMKDPALIILDEEHDGSYKQGTSPRYHARQTARERARLSGGAVVLGSATPSVESFHAALSGNYTLLELPERVRQRPLPAVEVIDLRAEMKARPGTVFGRRLEEAIGERLSRGEQTILFLNRRGFSAFLLCRDCGHVPHCPNCDVSLTLHRHRAGFLLCHHCDYNRPAPRVCERCMGPRVRQFGIGTQRVEDAVRQAFPQARVARLDRDSTSTKDAHTRIVSGVLSGDVDILVGTQMVTKGFDFPGVTLVGVVTADVALNMPDFRAAERSFQLLTQVSGRAGRGDRPGEVVVQTFNPEHPSIQAASRHDYRGFYNAEIRNREELGYPPFGSLARLLCSHLEEAVARSRMEAAAELLHPIAGTYGVQVRGPAPCPLSRLKDRYRWHLLLKAPSREAVRAVLDEAWPQVQKRIGGVVVDVEPVDLL